MSEKYKNLFTPLKVNNMYLRNRIISAPCAGFEDKALGGVAVITRGGRGNVPDGRCRWRPGPYVFETLASASKEREKITQIHQCGAKAELQLVHAGQSAVVNKGDYAIGPMSFAREDGTEVKALNYEMMLDVCKAYGKVASDAKEYGYDMVMLHFAHGWLPTQFLSPHFNKRTDEYGGCPENRYKFPAMIVDAVRKAVGKDFPVNMRITIDEHLEDGSTPEEIAGFIKSVQDKIDMVQLTAGLHRQPNGVSSTTYVEHMYNRKNARLVKGMVNIPVAVVGAIFTPEEAEDIIASGDADAVVLGRALIADPMWAEKLREGREDDIVPCLRCMNCSTKELTAYGSKNINCCSVNPRHLHEDLIPLVLEKKKKRKSVYVIGGGPGGMKAALTASEIGHKVVLMEKTDKLGGQLICSDYDPAKEDLHSYLEYLRRQIKKSNVEVRLNCDANQYRDDIRKADALIIAVGASPAMPNIPGSDKNHVINAVDAYQNQNIIGNEVAIIGGGSIGIELAKMLHGQGKTVHVIEMTDQLCSSMNDVARMGLLAKIAEIKDLDIRTCAQCDEILDNGVSIVQNGNRFSIKADTVIMAVGMRSNRNL